MTVPAGKHLTIGVRTYREGDELPADVPEAFLSALSAPAAPAQAPAPVREGRK